MYSSYAGCNNDSLTVINYTFFITEEVYFVTRILHGLDHGSILINLYCFDIR